jgi:hypothetical protein
MFFIFFLSGFVPRLAVRCRLCSSVSGIYFVPELLRSIVIKFFLCPPPDWWQAEISARLSCAGVAPFEPQLTFCLSSALLKKPLAVAHSLVRHPSGIILITLS